MADDGVSEERFGIPYDMHGSPDNGLLDPIPDTETTKLFEIGSHDIEFKTHLDWFFI